MAHSLVPARNHSACRGLRSADFADVACPYGACFRCSSFVVVLCGRNCFFSRPQFRCLADPQGCEAVRRDCWYNPSFHRGCLVAFRLSSSVSRWLVSPNQPLLRNLLACRAFTTGFWVAPTLVVRLACWINILACPRCRPGQHTCRLIRHLCVIAAVMTSNNWVGAAFATGCPRRWARKALPL